MKKIGLSFLALAAFCLSAPAETNTAPANVPPAPAPAAGPAGGASAPVTMPPSERANQSRDLRAVKSGKLPSTVKASAPHAHKSARRHHRHAHKHGGHAVRSHHKGHRHHRRHK